MAASKIIGIYEICSAVNGRRYIGSSANISKRWYVHRHHLRKGTHHSPHLQRAWDKYGEEAFEFVVLEECPVESLIEREQHHFDLTSDKYNCALVAGSRLGISQSPEAIAKTSAANKGRKLSPEHRAKLVGNTNAAGHTVSLESRAKMSAPNKGRKLSPEHRAKIGDASRGRKASPETRAKMSAAQKGRTHSDETREKLRQINTGRKASPEARAKMSAAQTGNTNTLGRTLSPEHRAKISAAAKAQWERQRSA